MTDQKNGLIFFKKDKNQRLIYGIGIILWIILWFKDLEFINKETIGIYSLQIIIPTILLIGQLIFNNRTLWTLLVIYFGIYTLWILWNMIYLDILIDYHRDYSPQPFWTFEKVKDWIIMISILIMANWIIWKIKPQRIISIE